MRFGKREKASSVGICRQRKLQGISNLLCSKFGISANAVINNPYSFESFKGAFAKNYVMQALVANRIEPYYWTSDGKAES